MRQGYRAWRDDLWKFDYLSKETGTTERIYISMDKDALLYIKRRGISPSKFFRQMFKAMKDGKWEFRKQDASEVR